METVKQMAARERNTTKECTKLILLETGRKLFLERGYANAGLELILQVASVPKGSFYHYFQSKEDFGLQVIEGFARGCEAWMDQTLGDRSLSPLDRLRRYFEGMVERLANQECRNGCLVGRLSQEMADQSEAFRARLETIFSGWTARLADCLREARDAGQIAGDLDVDQVADVWMNGWQGAILRAKTARSAAPLTNFLDVMFNRVLRRP
jgi:TetR/AcrR family transcriptional repressor of nem operon